jgi:hypothetical protein
VSPLPFRSETFRKQISKNFAYLIIKLVKDFL